MSVKLRHTLCASLVAGMLSGQASPGSAQPAAGDPVRIVADEAEAALALLDQLGRGVMPAEAEWRALEQTEGFQRLQERERSMQRAFDLNALRVYLTSDSTIARRDALARTLASWRTIDLRGAMEQARSYLPPEASLRVSVYLLIKPQPNTFVFGLPDRPGIYLYIDPAVTAAQLANTITHELHHIGYGTTCPSSDSALPEPVRIARRWLLALGEGYAMLAAAGGADVHPHRDSPPADRARWDADVVRFDDDLRTLDRFFLDVLDGRIDADEATRRAREFYGVQGPWYTVGWRMAATIEEELGRERLVDVICDPALVLAAYREAAEARARRTGIRPAVWSERLLAGLTATTR